jgi:hypothetical protein
VRRAIKLVIVSAAWFLLFGHEHVMAQEFQIIMTLITEFFEIMVPALVLVLEMFLYFGYNTNVVPTKQSADVFLKSSISKLLYIALQICTFGLIRVIVNNCSELASLRCLSWIIKQNFEVLIMCCTGALILCYTAMIPHYNFNVRATSSVMCELRKWV